MLKKVLFTTGAITLIVTSPLLKQRSIFADQISTKNINVPVFSLINSKTENQSIYKIIGTFYTSFIKPYDPKYYNLGKVENSIPNGVLIDVANGGPESLIWTAAIYNFTTGKRLTEFIKFQHGTNAMRLAFDKTQVKIGDTLGAVLVNDNFPNDVGFLHIEGKFHEF